MKQQDVNHSTAALILMQIAGESNAMRDYETLLATGVLDDDDVDKIREIISDEKNHSLVLTAMVKKYDGMIAASPDGVEEALNIIADGTKGG